MTDATTETIVFDLGQFEAATDSFETENKPGPKPEAAKTGVLKEDGTITWTINATPDITKDNSTLAGYTLTDTFTDRDKHTYVEGSLKLDGVPVADGQVTNSGFSYVFDEGISAGSHVMTFDTKVNQEAWYTGGKTVVKNQATLQMPGGGETVNTEAEVPIKNLRINKRKDNKIEGLNYKKNDDGSVEIYFAVDVEYKREAGKYNKVQIKDRVVSNIPADKISYLPGSILVKYDGQEETATPNYSFEGSNLVVDLDKHLEKATLYYAIKIASLQGLGSGHTGVDFKNYADLLLDGKTPSASDWEDTKIGVGAEDPIIYLDKNGTLAESEKGETLINWAIKVNNPNKDLGKSTDYKIGDKVNWKISLNKNGAMITKQNAVLKDSLPPGLVYQTGSAKLIGSDGREIEGLTATYDEETKLFSLMLPDGLDLSAAYEAKFTTDVVTFIKDLKNTISFDGSAEEVFATSGSVSLIAGGTSSGIESDNIKLTLNKVGENGKPLEGAEFALYNRENIEIGKATTNERGIAIFDIGLKYERGFSVKEIKAPAGFVTETETHILAAGGTTMTVYKKK